MTNKINPAVFSTRNSLEHKNIL